MGSSTWSMAIATSEALRKGAKPQRKKEELSGAVA
jgi:hypothetical protein